MHKFICVANIESFPFYDSIRAELANTQHTLCWPVGVVTCKRVEITHDPIVSDLVNKISWAETKDYA